MPKAYRPRFAEAALCVALATFVSAAAADDRHAGYYYPAPTSMETYPAEIAVGEDASAKDRAGFVVGIADYFRNLGYETGFRIFTKGAEEEKIIVVGIESQRFDTVYKVRAFLADMTSVARQIGLFGTGDAQEIMTELNFLDLCKSLGFERITISDGKGFSHQLDLE